jgi:TolB amino-terminal domain
MVVALATNSPLRNAQKTDTTFPLFLTGYNRPMRLHNSPSKRGSARWALALLMFSCLSTSQAQLSVDVSGVGGAQIPIAVGDFVIDTPGAAQVANVIRSDLTRLGMFKVIEPGQVSDLLALRYEDFRSRGADAVVGGRIARLPDDRLDIRFRLQTSAISG